MFIGHFAVGMAAKRVAPGISLGTLFIAAQFLDLLWPTLLLLGIERVEIVPGITKLTPLDFTHYPITHSLLMAIVWSVVWGVSYKLLKKNGKYALVIGLCVLSHWILDLLVHRPDLPLYPADPYPVGFGLWNHPAIAILLESAIFFMGVILYLRTTKAQNAIGRFGFTALVVILLLTYIANIFGPPPPNVTAIAWAGHLQWLFVLLAYWVDRNRMVTLTK